MNYTNYAWNYGNYVSSCEKCCALLAKRNFSHVTGSSTEDEISASERMPRHPRVSLVFERSFEPPAPVGAFAQLERGGRLFSIEYAFNEP